MKAGKSNSAKTVLTISIGFIIVFLLFNIRWALYTALVIGLLGIISNKISDTIEFLWMKLAKVLSLIVPNILLSAIFYFFLTPIAILSKILGSKNELLLKNRNDSMWKDKKTPIEKVSFEKMW